MFSSGHDVSRYGSEETIFCRTASLVNMTVGSRTMRDLRLCTLRGFTISWSSDVQEARLFGSARPPRHMSRPTSRGLKSRMRSANPIRYPYGWIVGTRRSKGSLIHLVLRGPHSSQACTDGLPSCPFPARRSTSGDTKTWNPKGDVVRVNIIRI